MTRAGVFVDERIVWIPEAQTSTWDRQFGTCLHLPLGAKLGRRSLLCAPVGLRDISNSPRANPPHRILSYGGKNPVSPKRVMEMYYGTVGRNANLLLGVAVESDGLVHENSVKVLEEFGAELKRRFGASAAETAGRGKEVVLKFDTATSIDHVVLMEDIAESERVRKYVVEGDVDGSGGWKELAGGSSIGHKKILQVEPIYVSAVRLRVIESVGEPQIRKLAVYNVGDRKEWGQQEQTGKKK